MLQDIMIVSNYVLYICCKVKMTFIYTQIMSTKCTSKITYKKTGSIHDVKKHLFAYPCNESYKKKYDLLYFTNNQENASLDR